MLISLANPLDLDVTQSRFGFIIVNFSSTNCCYHLTNDLSHILFVLLHRKKNLRPEDKIEYFISEKKDNKRVKAHVNSQFFKQLKFLLGEY